MEQPHTTGVPTPAAPRFYLTGRQPLSPAAILLAIVAAAGASALVLYALEHTGHKNLISDRAGTARSATSASEATDADDKDDPDQIDTIVLGDPADAPVPARRKNHVSSVHPTIIVHLPRFGEQTGLIPDTPAGRLLYGWLAAFNQANSAGMVKALPNLALDSATRVQMELRQQTGGFSLLSAKEVQPGVLVFRLRDQTPAAIEVLGTLQVLPESNPATIASFSLRAIPIAGQGANTGASIIPPAFPR